MLPRLSWTRAARGTGRQGGRGRRRGLRQEELLAATGKARQTLPTCALRQVCGSNSRPQRSRTLFQHSPQATLARVRPNVRIFPMHPRCRTAGLGVAWGCTDSGSRHSHSPAVNSIASLAVIPVAATSTIIATAPAGPSTSSNAGVATVPRGGARNARDGFTVGIAHGFWI